MVYNLRVDIITDILLSMVFIMNMERLAYDQ